MSEPRLALRRARPVAAAIAAEHDQLAAETQAELVLFALP